MCRKSSSVSDFAGPPKNRKPENLSIWTAVARIKIEFAVSAGILLAVSRESASGNQTLKPPLKWAGGKRWLVPKLLPYWQHYSDRRLVEPFSGGLAVALGLMPGRALLNDRNPHLISFYSWLRRGLKISIPMENNETL